MLSRWFSRRPDAGDVARRALVLRRVVVSALTAPPRQVLASVRRKDDAAGERELESHAGLARDEILAALERDGVSKCVSPWEREFFEATYVTMTEEQQLAASWRCEALAVLLWALGEVDELPPWDTCASHELVKHAALRDPRSFVRAARLRAREEIDSRRQAAELWHWRSRTRELVERGDVFPVNDALRSAGIHGFDDVIARAAHAAAEAGDIESVLERDFPARGKPYRDLDDAEWSEVRSIAIERHFALNWLCGRAPKNRWDETPTDT